MAITCKWDYVIGSAETTKGEKVTFYGGGNCLCIITPESHCLYDFMIDEQHVKNILKSDPNHYDNYNKIKLNASKKEAFKIAKLISPFTPVELINFDLFPFNY